MSLINEVKEYILPLLEQKEIDLYEIGFVQEQGMRILRVMITKRRGHVDLDVCSEVSELISAKLDEIDGSESEYYLEVCSAGAERELRTLEEAKQAAGQYVFLKLRNPYSGMNEVLGDLISVEDEKITVAYRVKTAKKNVTLQWDQIALIRLAVKV